MTLLRYEDLKELVHTAPFPERLVVTPLLDDRQIGPASIDLRLGTDFLNLKRTAHGGLDTQREVRPEAEDIYERLSVPLGQPLWLHPGHFVLGATLEFVRMPTTVAGLLVGRSSWARLGLVVETAGLVQPGYSGTLTYELTNMGNGPISLYPGQRVAQLVVYDLSGPTHHADLPPEERFAAKYLAAVGPATSRLAAEKDEMARILAVGRLLQKASGAAPE